jgi:very-short-patch-repair endonuclease
MTTPTKPKPSTKAKPKPKVDYEGEFAAKLNELGIEGFVRQFHFHPFNAFTFDFAWPALKVAVEVNGGQWARFGGRHNNDNSRERLNEALALGWKVLLITPEMMHDPLYWDVFLTHLEVLLLSYDNDSGYPGTHLVKPRARTKRQKVTK